MEIVYKHLTHRLLSVYRTCGASSWGAGLSGPTCSQTGPGHPGVVEVGAVQQVVALQDAVEAAEGGGEDDDVQRYRPSSGQEGVDQTPAEKRTSLPVC